VTLKNVPIKLRFLPKLNLIRISVDAGNGKGEQTVLAVSPAEAMSLGDALTKIGLDNGGKLP
jgi:hypothetical protein